MRQFTILHGDVREVLPTLAPGTFDACLCDPPYGLSFMGKAWDHGVPSAEVWSLALAALRPGAPLMAFGGTRTFHRLTCAIEDAGFEVRDCLCWLYGQGFPKSLSVARALLAGVERQLCDQGIEGEIQWWWPPTPRGSRPVDEFYTVSIGGQAVQIIRDEDGRFVTPAEVRRWEPVGTALKPAWEPIVLAMKPLAGTFASNALEHGVAGLNVDGCRVGDGEDKTPSPTRRGASSPWFTTADPLHLGGNDSLGRWPANVLLDEEAAAMLDEQSGERPGAVSNGRRGVAGIYCDAIGHAPQRPAFGDSGGASRFFYTAKADSGERTIGGVRTNHPTLKPIDLCAWLAKLILPPPRADGQPRRLLVPFSGAGSEVAGALRAGWDEVVGIEREAEYAEMSRRRVAGDAPLWNRSVTEASDHDTTGTAESAAIVSAD